MVFIISRIGQSAIALILTSLTLVSCASTAQNPSTSGSSAPAEPETPTQSQTEPESEVTLTAIAKTWQDKTHIHSIALNSQNPDQLYIATHHGILQYSHPGEWFQVG